MNNLTTQTKILTFVLLSSIFTNQAFALPAFPGAEGAGAETIGGRGGRIIEVTNLNGSGQGSLREALEASGPRTVVFKVAGTIDLNLEPIYIKEPYLTIAGQTAPEGGITLKGEGIQIRTHDVVVRYIKLRPGVKRDIESTDGMGMQGTGDLYRNIVDHCSMSWANDENSQIWSWSKDVAPHDITYSWNIISEGFDEHSCGFLAGSYDNTKDFKDVSLHHNLFANTSHRLPLIKIASAKMVNNLIYNWSHYATGIKGGAHMDIIANKYKTGPETSSSKDQEITVEDSGYGDPTYPRSGAPGYASIYIEGNVGPNNSDPSADNWKMAYKRIGSTNERVALNRETFERTTPLAKYEYSITIDSIEKAESSVLQDSGASKRINEKGEWVTNRDKIDKRIISEYENGTGFIPVNEDAVGGYPTINAGTPYADSDHDGMADVWEELHGLDKNNYSDNSQDSDSDGYTNIEEFINGTKPNNDGGTVPTPKETDPVVPDTEKIVVQSRVASSSDDAEESSTGTMYLSSSDLELIEDKSTQTVGLRFAGLDIPQNVTITKAYIQFKSDETDYVANTVVKIRAQKSDNATTFKSTTKNISSRAQTNASVSWSPARWDSVGTSGTEQSTSDLTEVMQEVVSQTGWNSGNALAFIFTGSGKRVAESYDGDKAGAALLYVEYTNDAPADNTDSDSDTVAPVMTLLGDNPMTVNIGDDFTDPGVIAQDDVDGDITDSVLSSSNVDTEVAGIYYVTYTVTDIADNSASVSRTVMVSQSVIESFTLQSRVASSSDDAEESSTGTMYLNSSDLELIEDKSTQTVGLRFAGLDIPQNVTITKAYIQFKSDETDYVANTVMNISAEKSDNALTFTDVTRNISSRVQITASVSWSPAKWDSVGTSGAEQRTSDLTNILQEIVSQTGWNSGNALAFIFAGSGKRVAESYDGDKAGAPLLYVEYTTTLN